MIKLDQEVNDILKKIQDLFKKDHPEHFKNGLYTITVDLYNDGDWSINLRSIVGRPFK